MCIEFDLAWAVKENVAHSPECSEAFDEPVDVRVEVLHAIEKAAVGPQRERLHDATERDELAHVNVARIGQPVVRRVQVDDGHRPAREINVDEQTFLVPAKLLIELPQSSTIRRLAGPGRAQHDLRARRGEGPSNARDRTCPNFAITVENVT